MAFVDIEPNDLENLLVTLEEDERPEIMNMFLSRKFLGSDMYLVSIHEATALMDGRFVTSEKAEKILIEREKKMEVVNHLKEVDPYIEFNDIENFTGKLRLHQHNAVFALAMASGFCNGDAVGTGKTIETVAACCLHGEPAIIVCEVNKIGDWEEEFNTYSKLKCVITKKGDNLKKRKKTYEEFLTGDNKILITNYEKIRVDSDDIEKLVRFRPTRLYLDEASKIKSVHSKIHRAVYSLGKLCSGRYALTATPYGSSIMDYYAIMRFIMPDLAPDFYLFRDRHCKIHERGFILNTYKHESEFKRRFQSFVISRSKDDINTAGGVVENNNNKRSDYLFHVSLSNTARDEYDHIERKLDVLNDEIDRRKREGHGAQSIRTFQDKKKILIMTQLRVTVSPHLEGFNELYNEKYETLCEVMTWLKQRNKRAIIFSRWARTIDWINDAKPPFTWVDGRGSEEGGGSIIKRVKAFKEGNQDAIITTTALQRGQNFEMCDAAIHLDMPANTEAFDQRNGRIDRGNRINPMYFFYIITKESRESVLFTRMRSHVEKLDSLNNRKNKRSSSTRIIPISSISEVE